MIWCITIERDHRDYSYIIAETKHEVRWLDHYHTTYPDDNLFFFRYRDDKYRGAYKFHTARLRVEGGKKEIDEWIESWSELVCIIQHPDFVYRYCKDITEHGLHKEAPWMET